LSLAAHSVRTADRPSCDGPVRRPEQPASVLIFRIASRMPYRRTLLMSSGFHRLCGRRNSRSWRLRHRGARACRLRLRCGQGLDGRHASRHIANIVARGRLDRRPCRVCDRVWRRGHFDWRNRSQYGADGDAETNGGEKPEHASCGSSRHRCPLRSCQRTLKSGDCARCSSGNRHGPICPFHSLVSAPSALPDPISSRSCLDWYRGPLMLPVVSPAHPRSPAAFPF
jgi:hypothetical protein